MDDEERVALSADAAIAMLPDKPDIHTFRQVGPVLMGADYGRDKVLDTIKSYTPELSGALATKMRHGIVLRDDIGWLFIETRGQGETP